MPNTAEQLRQAAATIIARELAIDLAEAKRWCDAWERFAKRNGANRDENYWDAARGWIDAQRSFEQDDRWPQLKRVG